MERVYDFFSMLRGRGYRKLENVETTEDPDDEVSRTLLQAQQDRPYVRPFPKKEIIVGICMLVVGTTSIGLGALIRFGHWRNELPGSALAYVCLGMLLFVPGAYASAIALGSWLNLRGFRYEQMPQMPRAF